MFRRGIKKEGNKHFTKNDCLSKIKSYLCGTINQIILRMNKSAESKTKSVFQKILEDKRAIRKCIQNGEDIKKIAKEREIKFATPL